MKPVHYATSLAEAHLVRATLASEGIVATLVGEGKPALIGAIPARDAMVQVCVEDHDALAASAILNRPTGGPDRECRACGETSPAGFETCWACRAEF